MNSYMRPEVKDSKAFLRLNLVVCVAVRGSSRWACQNVRAARGLSDPRRTWLDGVSGRCIQLVAPDLGAITHLGVLLPRCAPARLGALVLSGGALRWLRRPC